MEQLMAVIEKRILKAGKGIRFRARIRVEGLPDLSCTFRTRVEAVKWAKEAEASQRERKRALRGVSFTNRTFEEAAAKYEAMVLPIYPKTQRTRGVHLRWWREQLRYKYLCDITPATIAELRDELAEEVIKNEADGSEVRRSNATVNRYLATLSHLLGVAVKDWAWLQSNVALNVRKRKEPRGRIRYLCDTEREKLLAQARKSECAQLYTIVVLALSTGARKMEILGLKWEHVDLNRKLISIIDTKNGERRSVPLLGHGLVVLKEYAKVRSISSPYVFPDTTGTKPRDIRTAWETALRHSGIRDFRFHDLRHTCASYLAMDGASPLEIAEVLGHKTLSMVRRYSHLSEGHVASVVERMNRKIFG